MTSTDLQLSHVHIGVADLDRAVGFYQRALGLQLSGRSGDRAAYLAAGPGHHAIGLIRGGPPVPTGDGDVRAALRVSTRRALAEALQRLQAADVPLTAATDHGICETLYFSDLDGNRLALCWDRPGAEWPRTATGALAVIDVPLDVDELAALAQPSTIRTGQLHERAALESLQRRASLVWTTYREQLAAHPGATALPAEQFEQGRVRVAERAGRLVGFAVILPAPDGACELDGLFVEPDSMGGGIGRLLVEDGARVARGLGADRLEVVANPHAVGFYERCDFTAEGEVSTLFGPALRMRRVVQH